MRDTKLVSSTATQQVVTPHATKQPTKIRPSAALRCNKPAVLCLCGRPTNKNRENNIVPGRGPQSLAPLCAYAWALDRATKRKKQHNKQARAPKFQRPADPRRQKTKHSPKNKTAAADAAAKKKKSLSHLCQNRNKSYSLAPTGKNVSTPAGSSS